jgi:2-polyprenyl-3-methyl-5-hydroxy-6-metoxy-1,4-benzoquinol methylase
MLTGIQYRILKRISPRAPDCCSGSAYEGKSKLAVLMGDEFFTKIAGKVIIDFGCGEGAEAVEMTGRGAQRVIGIDIREDLLQAARQKALGTVSKILVSSYLRRRSLRTSSFPWTPLSISPTPRESCVS